MFNQLISVTKRNIQISFRSWEIYLDITVPVLIALLLSMRTNFGTLSTILPILYSMSVSLTSRSIMIRLIREKSTKNKETKQIIGLKKSAYTLGWFLSSYLRMTMAVSIFILSYFCFALLFQLDWDFFYRNSFGDSMYPYFIYAFATINQSIFYASIFDDARIAGEIHTFFSVGLTFLIFMTFITQTASSMAFYVFSGIFSPQALMSLEFISLSNVGGNRLGCKIEWVNPRKPAPYNIFPSELVNQTFTVEDAGYIIIGDFFLYLLLFILTETFLPSQYGIKKTPYHYLKKILGRTINTQGNFPLLDLNSSTSSDNSSAVYEEKVQIDKEATIIIQNLSKSFGRTIAVDNISLQLYESQIFCLLGHNGAGKTTTISLLTGLIEKSKGIVKMYGMDLEKELSGIRQTMGLCTQQDILDEELTVNENLNFVSKLKGYAILDSEIQKILVTTDLIYERNKIVKTLSGGSKRKLSLAIALVGNSKILFLDEPTSGMDAYSRKSIWEILRKIKYQKKTIILTTHHLDEADQLADRIGIMAKGSLLAIGTPEYIKQKFGEGYKVQLRGENLSLDLMSSIIPNSELIVEQSSQTMLTYDIKSKDEDKLKDLFKILDNTNIKVDLKLKTLEDAFIKIGEQEDHFLNKFACSEQSMVTIQSEKELDLPICLTNPPQYNWWNQTLCMFQRRQKTILRSQISVLAIVLPLFTFIIGLVLTEYLDLPRQVEKHQDILNFYKLTILACLGVLAFTFNSTLYIIQPIMEKESLITSVLKGSGLGISSYWFGTLLFDYCIFCSIIVIYFATGIGLQLQVFMQYVYGIFMIFITFGFAYLTYIYLCSFLFKSSQSAMKMYMLFSVFGGFIIPIVILGLVNQFSWPGKLIIIYLIEMFLMVFTPFFNYFFAYVTLHAQYVDFAYQFNDLPLIFVHSYNYWIMMLIQAIIYCLIIYNLEKGNIQKLYNKNQRQFDIKRDKSNFNGSTIQVQNISKKYDNDPMEVLSDISFNVEKGQTFSLIGPNKAGKSTLINIISGVIQQSSGIVQVLQNDVRDRVFTTNIHVGICPQFDSLWESLTTEEHLYLYGRIKGLKGNDLKESVDYFIHSMELTRYRKTRAGALSGGNKRKLCVSNALIGGSDITFFDEPSTGVDPISRKALFRTLKRNVQYRKCTAILVTHTIDEAESLGDQIGILVKGKFACIDTPDQLKNKYAKIYQIQLMLNDFEQNEEIVEKLQFKLKGLQLQNFNEIKKTLSFQIPIDTFNLNLTYILLAELKNDKIIEEFSISQGSLETIFIGFSSNLKETEEFID